MDNGHIPTTTAADRCVKLKVFLLGDVCAHEAVSILQERLVDAAANTRVINRLQAAHGALACLQLDVLTLTGSICTEDWLNWMFVCWMLLKEDIRCYQTESVSSV